MSCICLYHPCCLLCKNGTYCAGLAFRSRAMHPRVVCNGESSLPLTIADGKTSQCHFVPSIYLPVSERRETWTV